jgi:hypothetical protein
MKTGTAGVTAHTCVRNPLGRVERRVRRSSKSDLSAEARRAKEEGGSDTHQLLTMKVSLALHADLPPLQIKFLHWAAANQPDGQITSDYQKWCQAPKSKIFLFSSDPNQFTDSLSRPTRGAIARRHERGAGCGGRESVRRATAIAGRDEPRERCAACRMIGAFCVRQNRVVLAPVAGAKFAEARRPDRADKTLIRG